MIFTCIGVKLDIVILQIEVNDKGRPTFQSPPCLPNSAMIWMSNHPWSMCMVYRNSF